MDYAEDMNPVIVLLGIVMFFSAFAVQADMLANFIGIEFSIIDSLIFMVYGASTLVGGFRVKQSILSTSWIYPML